LAAEPLERLDGTEAFAEALVQLEAAMEELALLAGTTSNDPGRLGRVRARLDAMGQRIMLLRLGGYLPASWRAAMTEADMRLMAGRIRVVLEKHDPSD